MPARNLIILILAAFVSLVCYQTATRNHYGSLLARAIGEINATFVRPVEDRKLFEGAMEGMVRQLDPYSDYIDPEELAAFQEDLDQKFGGIGIVVEVNRVTGRLTVLSPLPDTPAFEAGMRAGDQILEIDGKSTEGFQITDAVSMMRGEPGTSLTVSVLHIGASKPVKMRLQRAIIPVASVLGDVRNPDGTWQFTMEDEPDIGLIRLSTFGEKTAAELRATLTSLKPRINGLILDLRGNGGGLLNAAVEVCDLFIDSGRIVSIRGRDQKNWRNLSATSSATVCDQLPMVILIDGYSASASEITAACLQDHHRAIVVGTRSWGKGTVQNVIPFEGGKSRLKLTVATYWRPSGHNIHRHVDAKEEDPWGVKPNPGYEVPTDDETLTKIILLRQERDKVKLNTLDDGPARDNPEPDKRPSENQEEAGGEAENPSNQAESGPELDISGFEDPQLKRAVEAIRELISGEAAQPVAIPSKSA